MNLRRAAAVLLAVLVAACSHTPPPGVEESPVVPRKAARQGETGGASGIPVAETKVVQSHTVEKGDTLYSIAFRYGMDFKVLAAINGIRDPYTIYPGQVLTIKTKGKPVVPRPKPVKAAVADEGKARPATATPAVVATPPAVTGAPEKAAPKPEGKTEVVRLESAPLPTAPKAVANPVVEPETKPAPAPAPAASASASASASAVAPVVKTASPVPAMRPPAPTATRVVGGGSWRWPVSGKLLNGFNPDGTGPKGISIGGEPGTTVYAARDGRVVYTGSSLVGYGQLVIVKHDDVYLSAYAHNSRLLVKEGDSVKAGDPIAEMGSTGTDRTRLHFEVRRNGDPVDPLSVLPPS